MEAFLNLQQSSLPVNRNLPASRYRQAAGLRSRNWFMALDLVFLI